MFETFKSKVRISRLTFLRTVKYQSFWVRFGFFFTLGPKSPSPRAVLHSGCCRTSSNASGEISFAHLSINSRPGGSHVITGLLVLDRLGVLFIFQALRSVCMGGNPFHVLPPAGHCALSELLAYILI